MRQLAKGVDTIGILARPKDFSSEVNKVVWLDFKDIYEVYHLDAMNTDLVVTWCVSGLFLCLLINLLRMWIY
jgi:hypothetical protein